MRTPTLLLVLGLVGCSSGGGGSTQADAGAGGDTSGGAGAAVAGGGTSGSGGANGTGGGAGGGASVGCTTSLDCPGGARCDAAAGACRPACRNDFECGDRARCRAPEGFCEPLPACDAANPCADGAACNCHGVCEPRDGAPCRTDLQCAVSEYCDACAGACKPRVTPCGRCGDTAAACERPSDLCLPVGGAGLPHCLRGCAGQPTCDALGPGYTCQDVGGGETACVPTSGECAASAACVSDAACPGGEFCNDAGVCQRGCASDNECPNGDLCDNLRCRPACSDAAPCAAPGECQADGHCRVPGGCLSSAECLERETHCDLTTHRCAPGCERDADCLSAADECVDARCRPRGCVANYQCAFGEVCEQASGECRPAGGHHCESPCDPMDEAACGGAPNKCLSLQDADGNALGDFCFEACQAAPNECPQGYQCVDLNAQSMSMGMPAEPPAEPMFLCIRRCDQEPIQ
jgi:hypothetical protein